MLIGRISASVKNTDDPRPRLLEHRPELVGVPFRPAVLHNHLDNGHAACLRRAVAGPVAYLGLDRLQVILQHSLK